MTRFKLAIYALALAGTVAAGWYILHLTGEIEQRSAQVSQLEAQTVQLTAQMVENKAAADRAIAARDDAVSARDTSQRESSRQLTALRKQLEGSTHAMQQCLDMRLTDDVIDGLRGKGRVR